MILPLLLASIAPILPLPAPSERSRVDDAQLVQCARQGQAWALRELYFRYARPIAARMTRLLSRSAEAEDAVQDTFLEAFRDLEHLRVPVRFEAWLMQIATHQAFRRLRRRRLLYRLGLEHCQDDATLEQLAAPECDPDLRFKLAELDATLRELDARLRLAWMLRMVEGCDLPQVAELCGCSLATAKRRIARAREIIAQQVDMPVLGEVVE
jgi:RNA polymerase sigma-70 factor (ECF subfamily)